MTNHNFPPLDQLISEIIHGLDACPEAPSSHRQETSKKDRRQPHKRRGNQFIRFNIKQTHFALPLEYALEIMPMPDITPLPNLPGWILGIFNFRGEIVSVVELAQLLKDERGQDFTGSHLIISQIGHMKTGFLVDKIGGIFFDGDPDHKVEEQSLIDKTYSQFAKSTFVSSQYKVHLLEVTKLLPALKSIQ